MAIFRCKACGSLLETDGTQSEVTCIYCETKQTLPKLITHTPDPFPPVFPAQNDRPTPLFESAQGQGASPTQTYQKAVALGSTKTESSLRKAIELLLEIPDWMDSSLLIVQYEAELAQVIEQTYSLYSRAVTEMENGIRLNACHNYAAAIDAYQAAENAFLSIAHFQDSQAKAAWCTQQLEELKTISNPTLTFMVKDSLNPLSLANGTYYVYNIQESETPNCQTVTLVLQKGLTTATVRTKPGDYQITLNVYGWDTPPGTQAPMHTVTRLARLERFDNWQVISNRPGLFSGVKLDFRKT